MPPPSSVLDELAAASAAPEAVRAALARFGDERPDDLARLAADDELAGRFVSVVAASRSSTRLLEADPSALDVLADPSRRALVPADDTDALVRWKRLEFLRIATEDLTGAAPLERVGEQLATMAADVLDAAVAIADATGLAVIGMGKLGGAELNYASDIDVVFVGDDGADLDRSARAVAEIARRCFRVDLNLRPEGRSGALVRTLASYEAYWEKWAEPWEFQALLKARAVAGDAALGEAFESSAATHLWERPFTTDDLRGVRTMKARSEAEVARQGLTDREVKRGRGGIRDIEFAVQLLQLVHAHADTELRSPTTLTALADLADGGYVGRSDADALSNAYRFLRTVEHRLQLVDEQQVHAIPAARNDRVHLARVLGFRDAPRATAVAQLDESLQREQATVRSIHERLYFRPLLEAFTAAGDAVLMPEAAATRLAAFGFTDVARTRQAVVELTRGLTRSSRLMQQLLPLLLDWLSESPDPDGGLLGLRNLASGPQRSMELATAFRDSPEIARRLCRLLGTSRMLSDLLVRNPDLIDSLGSDDELHLRSRQELTEGTRAAVAWRPERADRRAALKRFTDREGLRIAAHDVLELVDVGAIGQALTNLAEAALEATLDSLSPPLPFAIVAMGRLGGSELSYASDLDVVFVYDGTSANDFEAAERVATDLLQFSSVELPVLYDVDPNLRPEGRQGTLARSLAGFSTYLERWAQPWERLALVRARPVAGDPDVGARFMEVIEPHVWRPDGLTDDERRELRRIKARVERERIPPNEDPQFHLKLGKGALADVEFTAQLLQLEHAIRATSTGGALLALRDAEVISEDDHEILTEAHRFCERARNRWFLVNSAPGDALPQQPERLTRLARSLGTSGHDLRDEYRRVTRRSRRVVERLFYGATDG